MSLIASSASDLKFHEWPHGTLQHSYVPSKFEDGSIKSISWSRDGSWTVLVPSSGPTEIISIKDNLKLLQTIEIYDPTCAIFQNNTKKNIAIGTTTGQVFLYDIKARNIRKRFPKSSTSVVQIKYNSKDSHLAAAFSSGDIILYNNTTCNISSTYRVPNSDNVSALNFHRSKRNLVSAGSEEGIVSFWDINTNALLCKISAHQAPITCIAFSPIRSDLLVTGGLDHRFTFFDFIAKKYILEVEVSSSITALDFSYCGNYLGLGSQNGTVVMYDVRNFKNPLSTFMAHDGKKIRHILFQKILHTQDEKNNSVYSITKEPTLGNSRELSNQLPTNSVSFMTADISNLKLEKMSQRKSLVETADSFLAAMGINESFHQTNYGSIFKTEKLCMSEGSSEEVKKTLDKPLLQKSHLLDCHDEFPDSPVINCSKTKLVTSTPKVPNELETTHSPTLQEYKKLILPEDIKEVIKDILKEDFGSAIKDIIKNEFRNHLESYRTEIKDVSAEILRHMRKHFLDLQMSIVKQTVELESYVDKFNSKNTQEFICDEFLINQIQKLNKELDKVKERTVEKDIYKL